MAELKGLHAKCLIAALATGVGGSVAYDAGLVAAANLRRLTGLEIRSN